MVYPRPSQLRHVRTNFILENKRYVEYTDDLQVRLVRARLSLNMQLSAASLGMAGLRRPPTKPSSPYGTEDQILG